jgi:hypothetical protein
MNPKIVKFLWLNLKKVTTFMSRRESRASRSDASQCILRCPKVPTMLSRVITRALLQLRRGIAAYARSPTRTHRRQSLAALISVRAETVNSALDPDSIRSISRTLGRDGLAIVDTGHWSLSPIGRAPRREARASTGREPAGRARGRRAAHEGPQAGACSRSIAGTEYHCDSPLCASPGGPR